MEFNHDKKREIVAEYVALQRVRVNKTLVKGSGRLFSALLLLIIYKNVIVFSKVIACFHTNKV